MDKDLKRIYQKERELEFLISELPTMEEMVEKTNSVITKLRIFKENTVQFMKKSTGEQLF